MAELIDTLQSLVAGHEQTLWLLGLASVAMAIASVVVLPVLILRLPADYFVTGADAANGPRRGTLAVLEAIARNVLGAVLLGAGFAMLFLPGQGLLTILIAVVLLDFPGKRALERRLVAQRAVLDAANRLRVWRGRAPLQAPGRESR